MKEMDVSNRDDNLDETGRLLLHAVGELPDADSAALSVRLDADPALAQRLASIRSGLRHVDESFAAADAVDADVRSVARAKAAALQVVRNWQAGRNTKATPQRPTARARGGGWAMPVAAAAAVAVLILGGYVINQMLHPPTRPGYLAEGVSLPDLPDPFHYEQVARLAGDERPAESDAAPSSPADAAPREERSAALSEAVAIAAPLSDDPVLSFEVPLE